MYMPEDALPPEVEECRAHVKASLSGQLPEDTELVSGIYWIAAPHVFAKPVTDDIQHCSSRTVHPSSLMYVVAKCTQEDLPLKFNTLNGGVFAPSSRYGSISLTHSSGVGIASRSPRRPSLMLWFVRRCPQDESELSSYCARLDYSSSADIHSWEVNFTIMWDLELHIAVSILSAIIDLNIVTNHGVHFHCCRLLMPGTLRLMPEWVLTRRWCLKGRGSLWISQKKGLCWRVDGLSLHIHILERVY